MLKSLRHLDTFQPHVQLFQMFFLLRFWSTVSFIKFERFVTSHLKAVAMCFILHYAQFQSDI